MGYNKLSASCLSSPAAHLKAAAISFAAHECSDMMMQIPAEWLAEAHLQNFIPVRSGFRCQAPHVLIPLSDIEKLMRSIPLDANGFRRDRMMRILVGIRENDSIPPIVVERADPNEQPSYRLRCGVHRCYASLTLGFTHIPGLPRAWPNSRKGRRLNPADDRGRSRYLTGYLAADLEVHMLMFQILRG
jgi:hypothetical protein